MRTFMDNKPFHAAFKACWTQRYITVRRFIVAILPPDENNTPHSRGVNLPRAIPVVAFLVSLLCIAIPHNEYSRIV